ncbi:hypothetical protein [Paraburkholderia sp. HD33-4]|uniref:hypothetical protein n=1 Tax=Paraburkholderia sp. HD33-4 TaxID=2883242 RepID=UPI001F414BD6|nr:hypothetical protein [Paraburkholderia sp. HD33-4]
MTPCIGVSAANATDLYFAGFSFSGDYSQNSQRYKYAESLQEEKAPNGMNVLDAALKDQVSSLDRSDITLKYDLGDTTSGNAKALAFALQQESVEDVPRGDKDVYVYRVIGDVLVFDMQTRTLLLDIPAMAQYQDFGAPGRTSSEHKNVFRKMYLDKTFGANIFAEWVRRLKDAPVGKTYTSYMKVRNVTIAPEAEAVIPDDLKQNDAFETEVAQAFEYSLASAQNVGLVPYTKGQAIGQNMVERFANGNSYTLNLPDPDFVIDIRVRAFRQAKVQTNATDQYVFGSFITLDVEQPQLQTKYVDADFKNLNYVVLDRSEGFTPNAWDAYQTSLLHLFTVLTQQISKRESKTLAEITKAPDIDKQMTAFKGVVDKCM